MACWLFVIREERGFPLAASIIAHNTCVDILRTTLRYKEHMEQWWEAVNVQAEEAAHNLKRGSSSCTGEPGWGSDDCSTAPVINNSFLLFFVQILTIS